MTKSEKLQIELNEIEAQLEVAVLTRDIYFIRKLEKMKVEKLKKLLKVRKQNEGKTIKQQKFIIL